MRTQDEARRPTCGTSPLASGTGNFSQLAGVFLGVWRVHWFRVVRVLALMCGKEMYARMVWGRAGLVVAASRFIPVFGVPMQVELNCGAAV